MSGGAELVLDYGPYDLTLPPIPNVGASKHGGTMNSFLKPKAQPKEDDREGQEVPPEAEPLKKRKAAEPKSKAKTDEHDSKEEPLQAETRKKRKTAEPKSKGKAEEQEVQEPLEAEPRKTQEAAEVLLKAQRYARALKWLSLGKPLVQWPVSAIFELVKLFGGHSVCQS